MSSDERELGETPWPLYAVLLMVLTVLGIGAASTHRWWLYLLVVLIIAGIVAWSLTELRRGSL